LSIYQHGGKSNARPNVGMPITNNFIRPQAGINFWQGRVSRRLRKKIEMLFAHLKRILKLDRLRLRGPNGARDEFILAATAQNLRKMGKKIPMPTPRPA
jgi:hypothetical protein